MISIEQIKAARGLLDWTQDELSNASGVSKPSINTLERRIANPKEATLLAIQRAFENSGVEFLPDCGVKLRASSLKTLIFEGEDALIRLCQDIFSTLINTNNELMILGVQEKSYLDLGGKRVLEEIERRLKHNIRTKLLSCENDKNFIEPVEHYKWLPSEFFPSTPTYIYDNKYAIFLWGPPKKVVIIESQEIADSFRKQFLAYWKEAIAPVV